MKLYKDRCQKLMSGLSKNDVLLVPANPQVFRNNDVAYQYRQDSNLLYLTGWSQPDAVLLINASDCIFFCKNINPKQILWEGLGYGITDAANILGIRAYDLSDLSNWLLGYKNYYTTNTLSSLLPNFSWQNYSIKDRLLKDNLELECIKQAINFTVKGHLRLMSDVCVGISERSLYGKWLSVMHDSGLEHEAYPAIIAAGVNSCTLHYKALNSVCLSGQLLLVDAGMEYLGYAADITRTIPIDGRFSKVQKQVYEHVLRIKNLAVDYCMPGISMQELNSYVDSLYDDALKDLGVRGRVRQYAPHGVGHALGLDVHDIGLEKSTPITESAVITIEPGLYFAEQAIGVRIEDNYVMTSSGLECLSANLPSSVSEIEGLCD